MSVSVPQKRFINSPTLAALTSVEFGEEVLEQEEQQDLSDEYNNVTGNEKLYKTIFAYCNTKRPLNSVNGSEGFFGSIRRGIEAVLRFFANIFKGIWNMFMGTSSKNKKKLKEVTEESAKKLAENPIKYKNSIGHVTIDDSNNYSNLDWTKKAIQKHEDDFKELDKTVKTIKTILVDSGKLIDEIAKGNKPDSLGEAFNNIRVNNYSKLFNTNRSYSLFGYSIVAYLGKISMSVKSGYKPTEETFQTNYRVILDVAKKTEGLNKSFSQATKVVNSIGSDLEKLFKSIEKIDDESVAKSTLAAVKNSVSKDVGFLTNVLKHAGYTITGLADLTQ